MVSFVPFKSNDRVEDSFVFGLQRISALRISSSSVAEKAS